ncbi:MAG: hypothetical protein JJ902_03980 [Roseibium sp.]|nr:hypothetical protein [Roseibium sp.]
MKRRGKALWQQPIGEKLKIKRKRDKGVKPQKAKRRHPKITPDLIHARHWYALRVKSQKEFVTQDLLKERGLMTYVPVRKEWRHRNKFDRAKKHKELISFPEAVGYVFVGFTPNQLWQGAVPHWLKIFELPTVKGVVGINSRPARIPPVRLSAWAKVHPNGVQRPDKEAYMRTHKEFKEGDTARICNGPFADKEVPVKSIEGIKTTVILEVFGSWREIVVDTFDLEKVA